MMLERKRLDPVKTREAIFTAAITLFAERGYDGTSMADIAEAAGVQKSLVQYHFGSKYGLWSAAMEDRTRPMISMLERVSTGEVEARDLVLARFEMLRRNPEIARIVAWLAMQKMPLPEALGAKLKEIRAIAVGEGGPRIELLLALCSIDGWMQNKRLYSQIIGEAILEPAFEEVVIQQILRNYDRYVGDRAFVCALAAGVEAES